MKLNIFRGFITIIIGFIIFFLQFIIFPLSGYFELRTTFGIMAGFVLTPIMVGVGLIGIGIAILFSKEDKELE